MIKTLHGFRKKNLSVDLKSAEKRVRASELQETMDLHFTRTNGLADDAIDQLIALVGGIKYPEIVREMILAALKAGQENDGRADLKLMNSTLKEMRFTSKIFGPYRDVRKVSIFGSARIKPEMPLYVMARKLGTALVQSGYMVITGGGPGIMQAVNEGAGSENSFGVNIRLPFEQRPNPVLDGNPRYILYKYFFTRKVAFLKEASAIVLFPGGFGTLDEALETITLVQTGKRYPLPVILMEETGGCYWQRCLKLFEDELMKRGFIHESDFDLFERAYSIDECIAKINLFYRRYHSLRYIKEKLVIRLNSPLREDDIEGLKKTFADLLTPGGTMYLSAALEEECDEPEIAHLMRLALDFKRENFGRLRKFIDAVNGL
jgi:hypothetical protein